MRPFRDILLGLERFRRAAAEEEAHLRPRTAGEGPLAPAPVRILNPRGNREAADGPSARGQWKPGSERGHSRSQYPQTFQTKAVNGVFMVALELHF